MQNSLILALICFTLIIIAYIKSYANQTKIIEELQREKAELEQRYYDLKYNKMRERK